MSTLHLTPTRQHVLACIAVGEVHLHHGTWRYVGGRSVHQVVMAMLRDGILARVGVRLERLELTAEGSWRLAALRCPLCDHYGLAPDHSRCDHRSAS